MEQELFKSPPKLRGKMRELARWARDQRLCKTSDVVAWGAENYYVSAVRVACILAERGYLRRLTEGEVSLYFGKALGQGVWVPTEQLKGADLS